MATKHNKLANDTGLRKKKAPAYRSFRLSGKIAPDSIKKLPTTRQLWRDTWVFLWKYRRKMLLFSVIYLFSYLLFVKGFSDLSFDAEGLKEELSEVGGGSIEAIFTALMLYWSLLTSTTLAIDELTNVLQVSVLVIFSLAYIWLLRKLHAKNAKVTVKQAFYNGMRPLIPFLGVLGILVLELLPAGLGSLLYVTAQATTVNTTEGELLGINIIMILGIVMSVYLVSGSIFALYIVTLSDMTPIGALRSSMHLLRVHRWLVLRKILGFFATLIFFGFFLLLPFILWLPSYAELAFFVIGCFSFAITHTFLYKLYRSLL